MYSWDTNILLLRVMACKLLDMSVVDLARHLSFPLRLSSSKELVIGQHVPAKESQTFANNNGLLVGFIGTSTGSE